MGKFTIRVSDTVTYRRWMDVAVEAEDGDRACEIAMDVVAEKGFDGEEEWLDNTPYETEILNGEDQ